MNGIGVDKEPPVRALCSFLNGSALLAILLFTGLPLAYSLGTNSFLFIGYGLLCLISTALLTMYGLKLVLLLSATDSYRGYTLVFLSSVVWLTLVCTAVYLPVVARDALVHHLAIPSLWAQNGRPYEIQWHQWSYYPMLLQTVFTGLLYFGEWTCVLLHSLFLVLFGILLSLVHAQLSNRVLPVAFTYALVLFTPVCLSLAATPLVDLALAFYCGAVLATFFLPEIKRDTGVLAGIFLGTALSIKYNALLFVIATAPFLPLLCRVHTSSFKAVLRCLAATACAALIVYSPWLLRNALYTGNPFFPLFGGFFGTPGTDSILGSVTPLEKRMYLYGESGIEILLLPFRMLVSGEEGNPRLFDGIASPVFLLALFPLLRHLWKRSAIQERVYPGGVLLWYGMLVLYTTIALVYGPARVRYMAPIYFLIAILTVEGLSGLTRQGSRFFQLLPWVIILCHMVWGLTYSPLIENVQASVSLYTNNRERSSYRKTHVEYDLIQEVNKRVPPDSCTLLLYTGNSYYWYTGCVRSSGYHSASDLLRAIRRARSPEDLYNYFLNSGIRFIFSHTERTRTIFKTNLSSAEQELWSRFAEGALTLEFTARGYALWGVTAPAASDSGAN